MNRQAATAASRQMRLARLGAFYPTRLSFMRILLRALAAAQAQVSRPRWMIDDNGFGHAVYTVHINGSDYSLVAFSHALAPEQRSDRVIAEAWDTTYALYDGVPTAATISRLAATVPRQEGGRYSARELVLSRANKSVRFFEHTVARLAAGRQPAGGLISSVGYLMRTTAVYGNGKFGIADYAAIRRRPLFQAPFQAELLAVWLIREFTFDLAEHLAAQRAPQTAVKLAPAVRRYLGIGNATGLGMAPFLVSHPHLLHQWLTVRNTALNTVLANTAAAPAQRLCQLLARARRHVAQWSVADQRQQARIETLRDELAALNDQLTPHWLAQPAAGRRLYALAQHYSYECQELITALLLETDAGVNALGAQLSSDETPVLQPAMTVAQLQQLISDNFAWALDIDYRETAQSKQFWYVSAEKLEPRLGDRYKTAGCDKELPLDIARRVKQLAAALAEAPPQCSIAEFLLTRPAQRYAVLRVQTQAQYPYAEIQDNLIGEQCLPIDMLRLKLSFFGACRFDPKSDLWTRIALFQGAPDRATLHADNADDWWLPVYEDNSDAPLAE